MPDRRLYIWVEGDRDARFFRRVVQPLLADEYDRSELFQYAQERRKLRRDLLRSIRLMQDAGYIYVTDSNAAPCVMEKKKSIRDGLSDVEDDRVMVVVPEIESWYLAGLDSQHSARLGVSELTTTDQVTKERFRQLRPSSFNSDLVFMQVILECFSVETARAKNQSFDYFCRKFLPAEAQ